VSVVAIDRLGVTTIGNISESNHGGDLPLCFKVLDTLFSSRGDAVGFLQLELFSLFASENLHEF